MPDERREGPPDEASRGWVRALRDWLSRAPTISQSFPDIPPPAPEPTAPTRVAHYAITRKLGEGGMGVVYLARDERLQRPVALKMLSSGAYDDTARRRFWREARAAASVNHPNVCQIWEIGEDAGMPFIAMERLEGEPLDVRLRGGAMSVPEALDVIADVLAALAALHARGIVHRDLKPSNVFLTPHGVKVLDFGLARPSLEAALDGEAPLTRPGIVVGTPRYMAPEILDGGTADGRADLFAAGAMLFEMLAGRPAFGGRTLPEVLHATVHEQPPALTGSPAVTAVDRVIRRALAKRPADRYASAEAMADDLRAARGLSGDGQPAVARALTRLIVLPFRVLRPDADSDFLAFSLPDAIASSLAGNGSLVVRSSSVAARFAAESPDLQAIASEADVDRVVTGTLLRAGTEVRATVQLVEAPGGTLLASLTVQAEFADLFRLQDDVTRRVVEALSLPLSGSAAPVQDHPHDARAYELYLRGNELARSYDGIERARDAYERCLERDPDFAPAWARLGRCHRVISKFVVGSTDADARAEAAFQRALALNPRLTLAHRYYAQFEADKGQARQAMVRLLEEAKARGNDAELFAGLVHACRYAGLFAASMAAHAEARRLDPNVPTSVKETWLLMGDVERLLTVEGPRLVVVTDDGNRVLGLALSGRRDEARTALDDLRHATSEPVFRAWIDYLEAWLDRRPEGMVFEQAAFGSPAIVHDPEAVFQEGWLLAEVGALDRALPRLEQAVAGGYHAAPTLVGSPHFDAMRHDPRFRAVLDVAVAGRQAALEAFRAADGERLLGVTESDDPTGGAW